MSAHTDAPCSHVCTVDARVASCSAICREHVRIELAAPGFPVSQPGQFLQLLCRDVDDKTGSRGSAAVPVWREADPAVAQEWPADGFPTLHDPDLLQRRPYLRRPYSIADHWIAEDGTARLVVISRTVGMGSRWLEQLAPGQTLNITGPLGHGFVLPPAQTPIVLVGGGVGIPPLLYLTRRLHELRYTDVTMIVGATARDLLPVVLAGEPSRVALATACLELPGAAPYPGIVTSDDGSVGLPGRVTDGLRGWWLNRRAAPDQNSGAGAGYALPLVCACGPEAMLRAVALLTREWGLACQLCIERNMGCGIGTCLSCIVRIRAADRPAGWRWALACSDGPVFARDDLLDYAG